MDSTKQEVSQALPAALSRGAESHVARSAPARAKRPLWAITAEKAFEWLIRICGVSAVLFVLAIFFFVFRVAFPVFRSPQFHLRQFLFSGEWYPTSMSNVRFGTLALTIGSFSVTGVAMLLAVPFGLGAAIFVSEFCGPKLRETLKVIIGLLAAVLLGVARAVGETMAVLMATGHAVHMPTSILDSVRTLTANIAAELGEAPDGSDHYRVLFLTGVLLFTITFVVNLSADLIIRGTRKP